MFEESKVINKEAFFVYVNSKGEVSPHHIAKFVHKDDYFQGYSIDKRSYRTFRKDRVLEMFDDKSQLPPLVSTSHDGETFNSKLLNDSKNKVAKVSKIEICFTGFNKEEKDRLTELAKNNGLDVKSGVTSKLYFLCCGENAGPRKIELANGKGVFLITSEQFEHFIETGEILQESFELGQQKELAEPMDEKIKALHENAASTFNIVRSLQRSNALIAHFSDGYAAGWRFAVSKVYKEALDIKLTKSVFEGHQYDTWTQGASYSFHRGDTFYSSKLGYTDWAEFLKLEDAVVLQVKFECFAGYETIATLDGKFTGSFIPDNLITSKELTELPILIESQSYDAGTLTIEVFRPSIEREKIKLMETLVMDQNEFIALLQTGCYWKKDKGSKPIRADLFAK
ncbi:BRCT domain-containing protein [Yersinia proxima]|uniref:BRCT domain-containing protein n=1 Tax=Yersinia proxima TaxID=2890316 RepID=UPI001D0F5566|nr:BRCT domain-containing protein [Yersinia proxima]